MTRLGDVKACKRSGTPLFKWGATIVSEQRRSPDFVTRSPQSPDMHAATCTRSRPRWRSKISTRSADDNILDARPYLGGQVCNHSTVARMRRSAFTTEPGLVQTR